MIVRDEQKPDYTAIDDVTCAAFGQRSEADLISALRRNGDVKISLVAEDGGVLVAHALFTALQAPKGCIALGPISVAPERQLHGIGTKLIREGLARATKARWRAVFVLGEPTYYCRFGFRRTLAEKFETPYPKEYFMAAELVPGALAAAQGPVIYAAPFATLSRGAES